MTALIEPMVLADSKDYLLDNRHDMGYAVTDVQFQRETWGNTRISSQIRKSLRPFNSLRLGSGEPDALLAPPQKNTYRGMDGDSPAFPPLAVVEAKGEREGHHQNATRVAISQAHRHLGEVNVAFAAVPDEYITEHDRALAREANVGLVSVTEEELNLLEIPRLVGIEQSQTTETIRFHAQIGDTAIENLTKNHPKNALGYALAIQSDESTEDTFDEYVIGSVDDGRRDAKSLGLVRRGPAGPELTAHGSETVRAIAYHHGSVQSALNEIDDLYGSQKRFIN